MFKNKKEKHKHIINEQVTKDNLDEFDKIFYMQFEPYKEVPQDVIELILSAPHKQYLKNKRKYMKELKQKRKAKYKNK